LWTAFLVAISPFLNWYGNEIRMYSLFTLLTILNQYCFVQIFTKYSRGQRIPSTTWFGYIVTLILGCFTHYFFFLNAVTQAVFFLTHRKIFPRYALRTFLFVALILVIVFSPWVYYVLLLGSASNSSPQLAAPTSIDLFNTFSQFLFGFQNDHVNTILVSLWPLLVLLIFLSLRRNQKITPQIVYFFLSLFLPILLVFAVSTEFRPMYLSRYLILTLPSLYLLICWVISTYSRRLSLSIKSVLVVGMLAMLALEIVNAGTPVKENYRDASTYLTENVKPQDVIVVSAPFTVYPVEYYYRGPASIQTLPVWNRYIRGAIPAFSTEKLPEEVEAIKDDHQVLWLLLSYDQGYEDEIKNYFDSNYERVDMKNFSQDLNLYAYKLRYDVPNVDSIIRGTQ
jgi:hypothetical protein